MALVIALPAKNIEGKLIMGDSFIKKPCQHCPFRNDVKPYLHPQRAGELAYGAQNKYNTFPCHKTTKHDDDGEAVSMEINKECAGYLTLKAAEIGEENVYECKEGFVPSYSMVYEDACEMVDAYEEAAH